ncbi:MAG: hypothetical protein WCK34_06430 [Bacteroidota bacterium]
MTKSGIFTLFIAFVIMAVAGCKKNDGGNKTASSSHNSTASKKMGGVCQNCHVSGGSGPGWWTVAGTVYTEDLKAFAPNGTIQFFSANLTDTIPVATLEIDQNGNFYSSSLVLPVSGVYPQITGTSGNIVMMPQLCTSGNCNYCHGISCAKIWVN